MGRGRAARQPRDEALADVAAVLARLDRPAAIIGGLAVIAHGYARFTADIDCTIGASTANLKQLLTAFKRGGFEPRTDEALPFAKENLVLLLRHRKTGIEVDASLAHIEFELQALEEAEQRTLGGVEVPVPSLTHLFIYKLVAGRPKDLQDVEELLALGGAFDAARIETTLAHFDELLETNRLGDWLRLKRALA